ncbi:MAG: primosomal protein N', partial [Alphaproteobacteria bacterium]|nr:primosomal protein N' [Alphaproteobacteria bacterium]
MSRNEANSPSTVAVLLPLPLAGAYDYAVPAGLDLAPGDVVRVPLGKRSEIGIVWGPGKGDVAPTKLRAVAARLPAPPMTGELRRLIDFVARYAIAPPGSVLKMALPVPEALEAAKPKSGFRRADTAPKRLTPERGRVLGALAGGRVLGLAALVEAARVTEAVVRGLVAAGALESVAMEPDEPAGPSPDPDRDGPALTPDQATAATDLVAKVRARGFAPLLLDGVTGAGKTEVYFEAVAEALRLGRQVLVLVPEIALTAQWLERFVARFGAPPESWHSDLGRAERRRVFRAVAAGRAGVVVGARSALFLPFRDLGLIVVDEEHDGSFKQEDGVMYHARDMAVARAKEAGVPVVLASATPSLETLANVAAGRYGSLHLPGRYGVAELPRIEA